MKMILDVPFEFFEVDEFEVLRMLCKVLDISNVVYSEVPFGYTIKEGL